MELVLLLLNDMVKSRCKKRCKDKCKVVPPIADIMATLKGQDESHFNRTRIEEFWDQRPRRDATALPGGLWSSMTGTMLVLIVSK